MNKILRILFFLLIAVMAIAGQNAEASSDWTITSYMDANETLYSGTKTEVFDAEDNSLGYYRYDFLEQVAIDGTGKGDGNQNTGKYLHYDYDYEGEGDRYYLADYSLGSYNNQITPWTGDLPSVAVYPEAATGSIVCFNDLGPDAGENPDWVNSLLLNRPFYVNDAFSTEGNGINVYTGLQKVLDPSGTPESLYMASATVSVYPPGTEYVPCATKPHYDNKIVVGSYLSSDFYNYFFIKNVSAGDLTHLNYGFGLINEDLECVPGDESADYKRYHTAEWSVDGVADVGVYDWEPGQFRGNFNQISKLKELYPHLKVLISIGGDGATVNARLKEAASSSSNRTNFASSCIDVFIKGNFDPSISSKPDIFDGINIDWEFPGSAADKSNYTALMAEFRSQLDDLTATTGKKYELTIAGPAGDQKDYIDVASIQEYLDFIGVMTQDFHVPCYQGSCSGDPLIANFHSTLDYVEGNPDQRFYVRNVIDEWANASATKDKLVISVPFYGRGWSGVPEGTSTHGLWQTATGYGVATGTTYREIKALEDDTNKDYTEYRSSGTSTAPWLYSPTDDIFFSYDDPEVLEDKSDYVKTEGLKGMFMWKLSDDTNNKDLAGTIYGKFTDPSAVISSVGTSSVATSSATITWDTDEMSDTQIEYGTTTSYGSTTTRDINFTTEHSQGLSGLSAGTLYHYRVKSRDAVGNISVSGDYTFRTGS